mgnify:CR=1 FL=1|tara:strand:- start:8282 stop:8554 length:273 start_codon:yes stop_codon:yes gene_type:complete
MNIVAEIQSHFTTEKLYTYSFYEITPNTIWSRHTYKVEANSKDEALEIFEKAMDNGKLMDYHHKFEYMHDNVIADDMNTEWKDEDDEDIL